MKENEAKQQKNEKIRGQLEKLGHSHTDQIKSSIQQQLVSKIGQSDAQRTATLQDNKEKY